MNLVLTVLRAALAGRGLGELAQVLRRAREARKGTPLSAEERLEHRGAVFILVGFIAFLGYLVAPVLKAEEWVLATLVGTAIVAVVVGLGHYAASGWVSARGPE